MMLVYMETQFLSDIISNTHTHKYIQYLNQKKKQSFKLEFSFKVAISLASWHRNVHT